MKRFSKKINRKYVTRSYTTLDSIISLIAILVGVFIAFSSLSVIDKIVGTFGILLIILRSGSRISYVLSTVCLVSIPIFYLSARYKIAGVFAMYGFYFLIIGVITSIIENQPDRDYLTYKIALKRSKSKTKSQEKNKVSLKNSQRAVIGRNPAKTQAIQQIIGREQSTFKVPTRHNQIKSNTTIHKKIGNT